MMKNVFLKVSFRVCVCWHEVFPSYICLNGCYYLLDDPSLRNPALSHFWFVPELRTERLGLFRTMFFFGLVIPQTLRRPRRFRGWQRHEKHMWVMLLSSS